MTAPLSLLCDPSVRKTDSLMAAGWVGVAQRLTVTAPATGLPPVKYRCLARLAA